MKHSLKISMLSSFVVTSLLLATGCSDKEHCSAENAEASKITTHPAETKSNEHTSSKPNNQESENNMSKTVKTPSGLSYKIIQAGDPNSATPIPGSTVTVHYTGWLADEQGNPRMDKEFDSSVKRGTPFQFKIGMGHVIAGWDEGVMTMQRGEKRRLHIPSKLGYGASGAGRSIPPFANLVFDVELIDFK